MNLHDFQTSVIDDLTTAAIKGSRRLLLTLPTGAGKTHVAANIIRHAVSNGNKVLMLSHRRELVYQPQNILEKFGVTDVALMLSGDPYVTCYPVVIASIPTMHSWVVRRKKEQAPPADLIVVDEAHHLTGSKTWQDILSLYPDAIILGMTATPISRSGKGLKAYFDTLIQGPSIKDLTDQGYLVPAKFFAPSIPDLAGVKIRNGDYADEELEKRMDQPKLIGDILINWERIAKDRKTVIFASGVKHSIHLAESFKAIGVKAAHIDGNTDGRERDRILKDFASGEIQVVCNCAVLTEGWDSPSVSCLVFARPTKSLLLYLQVAGRVLRTHPGKKDCYIIDHAGAVYEHGLLTEDREWKLEYIEEKEKSAKIKKAREKKTITCKNCKSVYSGMLTCPYCHTTPEVHGKPVATYEAYLQALDAIEMEELRKLQPNKQEWWQMLRGYAIHKYYKNGWAWHKYKEKFGVGPSSQWANTQPLTPSLEVKSWIRHTQIKWAMSKKNPKNQTPRTESTVPIQSHGYARIDALAGNSYQPEQPEMCEENFE